MSEGVWEAMGSNKTSAANISFSNLFCLPVMMAMPMVVFLCLVACSTDCTSPRSLFTAMVRR